jgi:membrane protein implicated in regulation of membrane protease activity
VLLILGLVLLIALPSPWSFLAFVVCVVLFVGEITFFWRRVRGRSVGVGAETLIGRTAKVVTPCRPLGQVSLDGERWAARCEAGADIGNTVRIVARDELVLVVEREEV